MLPPETPDALLARLPATVRRDLEAALRAVAAEPVSGWTEGRRGYLWARGPDGPLFLTCAGDPADAPRLAHEAACRAAVRAHCRTLTAPEVLHRGRGVLVSRAVVTRPATPADAPALAAAVAEIAGVPLPAAPSLQVRRPALRRVRRLARSAAARLPLTDLRAARALLARSPSTVAVHGDLHAGNALLPDADAGPAAEGAAGLALVDWELSGLGPPGFDLAQLVATLPGDVGEPLWECALRAAPAAERRDLAGVRYAVAVRTLVATAAPSRPSARDPGTAARLRADLPALRRAADV